MTNLIDLNSMANTIAGIIEQGVEITVEDEKNNVKRVTVLNPANGNVALVSFKVPEVIDTPPVTPHNGKPVAKSVKKKSNSRWWSRFNFEKNIMTMCLFALQERYPAEESFPQRMFAERLAGMMHWKITTAYRHITNAAKMGIIYRSVVGTTYHVTGINDTDVETAQQQQVADREQAPEEMPLPFSDYYLEEGKPALEREIDKAVDETILP